MSLQSQLGGSKAAIDLTEKLLQLSDRRPYIESSLLMAEYGSGLNEMMKMNNPYRDLAMRWWHADHLEKATKTLKPMFDRHLIPFSYIDNILKYRLRQAMENGAIVEVLKERDPDWAYVVAELRKHRQWEDKQDREGA